MSTQTIPALNLDQCRAILTTAINFRQYETADGQVPTDEAILQRDAEGLLALAIRANAAGNDSELVKGIMFIGHVDQQPPAAAQVPAAVPPPPALALAPTLPPPSAALAMAPAPPPQPAPEQTLENAPDAVLDAMLTQLAGMLQTPAVEAQTQQIMAIKAQRGTASAQAPQAQAVAPPAPPQAPQLAPAPLPPASPPQLGGSGQSPVAPALPVVAAPVDERIELVPQLTLEALQAHGVDPTKIDGLTAEEMRFVIANPAGPPQLSPMSEVAPPAPPGVNPSHVGSVMQQPAQVESGRDFGPIAQAPGAVTSGLSPEREALEGQITGPMLKAWRSGRNEVPKIGDNTLRLMLANPDPSLVDQTALAAALAAAQAADGAVAAAPVAQPPVAPAPAPVQAPMMTPEQYAATHAAVQGAATVGSGAQVLAQAMQVQQQTAPAPLESGTQRAMAVIGREGFPIPADVDDPPILPPDVSVLSKGEIYSLHARFHALEVRINWVISEVEDELGDFTKMRTDREVDVAESIGSTVDGKKLTDTVRDRMIAADTTVRELAAREHESKKMIRKLRVLRDNWHLDCSRLSRQMSRWTTEIEDAK